MGAQIRRVIRHVLGASTVAVVVNLSAATAFGQATEAWDDVVAAAKREGSVVFYVGTIGIGPRALIGAFEKKYGIPVTLLHGRPTAIRERIHAEQGSGRFVADVHLGGLTTSAPELAAGIYQPHGTLRDIGKLKPPFKDNGTLVPISTSRYAILVNTNLVKPEDEPKSWLDLLDPKWRGKILATDPRTTGGGNGLLGVLYDIWGRDFIEKFAAQKPVLVLDPIVGHRRTAQGESSIYLPVTIDDIPGLKGLPVKAAMPKEGAPYIQFTLAMFRNAPHPNAARLFMNYYLEDATQAALTTFGAQGTTGVISDQVPPDIRKLLETPFLGERDPMKKDDMVEVFTQVFGRM